MYYYMLTIDRCSSLNIYPTISEYQRVIVDLCLLYKFNQLKPQVIGYEYKIKSEAMPFWIHVHLMISSNKMIPYKEFKLRGYSLNLKYAKTIYDALTFSGYIQKDMKSPCQIKETIQNVLRCKKLKKDYTDIRNDISEYLVID